MAFKMRGSAFNLNTGAGNYRVADGNESGLKKTTGMSGIKAEEDLKNEMGSDQKLGGRWKGMTLSEFDARVKEERESIGNDPKTLKAFDERQAKLRNQAINAAK